ncbi:MAG: HAD family hydrolase [Kiritimatiellae bacterium]|nr:HAD family hydrolase [Kiritimatiellia bacterium]
MLKGLGGKEGSGKMAFDKKSIRAVIFDYGNTLVEFSRKQVVVCDAALADALEKHFGKPDFEKLSALRDRDRLAPYAGDPPLYRENDLVEITTAMIQELYGLDPSPEQLAEILRARFEVFVRIVRAEPEVYGLLDRLAQRYRLGLLSNYPDGDAIRESLAKTGLDAYFKSVVVSADVHLVKPHPVPFLTILDDLRVRADQAVLVGDNWVADVQGGKRAGLHVVMLRRWETPEKLPRKPGDFEPDVTIGTLSELEALLL